MRIFINDDNVFAEVRIQIGHASTALISSIPTETHTISNLAIREGEEVWIACTHTKYCIYGFVSEHVNSIFIFATAFLDGSCKITTSFFPFEVHIHNLRWYFQCAPNVLIKHLRNIELI